MKSYRFLLIASLLVAPVLAGITSVHAQETSPIVHAVLFYSPACEHCRYVIAEVLPPLYAKYGSQLQIIGFDVSQPQGQALFAAAAERFGIRNPAVPLLIIDDIYLVGSQEIPNQLPALVKAYFGLGGIGWPDIPGLRELLISAAQTATAEPATPATGTGATAPALSVAPPASSLASMEPKALTWIDRFTADPIGNTLALLVLIGLIASLAWAILLFRRAQPFAFGTRFAWTIPWLCLIGASVAAYLAYVEIAQASAVCGPVGDCNAVQGSRYARLFGILPIGVLGLLGYLAIAAAWLMSGRADASSRRLASTALFVLPAIGTLFSVYLTFLEPFVIGATCLWCLLSSVLTAALMLLGVEPARSARSSLPSPARIPRARATRSRAKKTR